MNHPEPYVPLCPSCGLRLTHRIISEVATIHILRCPHTDIRGITGDAHNVSGVCGSEAAWTGATGKTFEEAMQKLRAAVEKEVGKA